MNALATALRKKFRTPHAAMEALGLDSALLINPQVNKESRMTKHVLPSRTAIRLHAGLAALAADEKIDLSPIVKGVTAKNLKGRRTKIVAAFKGAMDDIGAGATPDDVILRVLDMVEGQTKAEPVEADEAAAPATEPNAGDPAEANGGKMDKAKLMEWLKAKGMGEDDMAELDGMYGDPAEDEDETPEEKAERMRKEKAAADKAAKDKECEPMVSKAAMDQALADTAKTVRDSVLKTQHEIVAAAAYVRPWVGELAMDASITSGADVYRKALVTLKVDGADNLHVDALKPVLDVQPKPGATRRSDPTVAMDAAAANDFDKRFPHLANIRGA